MEEAYEYPDALPEGAARGRGAQLNPGNRFDTVRLHVLGEHLDHVIQEREAEKPPGPVPPRKAGPASRKAPPPRQHATRIFPDHTRRILNYVDPEKSPEFGLRWTLNPYRGCEHGCIYCYARPFHEQLGMSSGLDFETKIMAKHDAPDLLRKELAHRRWTGEPIMMGGVTDIYQPIESDLEITRRCLEVMAEARQPVNLVTKNRRITRDLDLLRDLAEHGAVQAAVSVTTLDASLAARMEPRTSRPADRLRAIRELTRAGVPTTVMVAPVVPGLTDREAPAILEAAAEAGARSAGYVLLRLPHQIKALFLDWLAREFPDRAGHVESLIRAGRGGRLYEADHGVRYRGRGVQADQLQRMFEIFRRRHGLDRGMPPLSSAAFRHPATGGQMQLF